MINFGIGKVRYSCTSLITTPISNGEFSKPLYSTIRWNRFLVVRSKQADIGYNRKSLHDALKRDRHPAFIAIGLSVRLAADCRHDLNRAFRIVWSGRGHCDPLDCRCIPPA